MLSAYCSVILLILLLYVKIPSTLKANPSTSSYWRDAPFVQFTSLVDFFEPRVYNLIKSSGSVTSNSQDAAETLATIKSSASEAIGGGFSWLRSLVDGGELYNGRFVRVML